MDSIVIRYGEDLSLPIDSGEVTDILAEIYIGRPGEAYVLSKSATLVNGVGIFEFSSTETELPLGTYYYQINTTDINGYIQKYPSPTAMCGDEINNFPKFIVAEALDVIEVS